jgi:hypothetical protein
VLTIITIEYQASNGITNASLFSVTPNKYSTELTQKGGVHLNSISRGLRSSADVARNGLGATDMAVHEKSDMLLYL